VRFVFVGFLTIAAFAPNSVQAEPDNSLQIYAVQILAESEQSVAGAGIYLGHGLVITASHVHGSEPPGVRIGGLNASAKWIKRGDFQTTDLALLSIDEEQLPISLRLPSIQLCQQPPQVGAPVILASPRGITRSQIASPLLLAQQYRKTFSTLISDVATNGKSGSGVFDAKTKCLFGIVSRKFVNNIEHKDIATYFVPATEIQTFVPAGTRWR
jgi:hypothetical protein